MNIRVCDYCGERNPSTIAITNRPNDEEPTILVQDIKRGLDNPILLLKPKPNDTFRYNPNKLAKELWQIDPKPKSLLERITNKIRRKDNGK